ncbi:hypothetical protein BH09BAC5_BH09BAC5_21540 [soil metagenome]
MRFLLFNFEIFRFYSYFTLFRPVLVFRIPKTLFLLYENDNHTILLSTLPLRKGIVIPRKHISIARSEKVRAIFVFCQPSKRFTTQSDKKHSHQVTIRNNQYKILSDAADVHYMKQHWKNYTAEDHAVWKLLFERQVSNLLDKAWSVYNNCIPEIGIKADYVPDFEIVEHELEKSTQWKIEVVKGIIPVGDFFHLLSNKRFCSSTWLRGRHQLDYLEEPDMFHDTFGHLPLLANKEYSDFVKRFADLGLKFIHNEKAVLLLERMYWFTIEFGMMMENLQLKIYGAGILSSFGESNHVFSDKVELRKFSVEDVFLQPFHNNEVQNIYFVVENMQELWNCLPEMESFLNDFVNGKMETEDFQFEKQLGSV